MKRINIFLCLVLILSLAAITLSCSAYKEKKSDYLRIHIRANSNSDADQEVKLKVRDEVVKYLTPLFCDLKSASEAKKVAKKNENNIVSIADKVLQKEGFSYKSSCNVTREVFPTRKYGDLTLESGEYDAIIVSLGEGNGNNWWCVAFPPLCFIGAGEGEVEYKSYLWEWWQGR